MPTITHHNNPDADGRSLQTYDENPNHSRVTRGKALLAVADGQQLHRHSQSH